MLGNGSYVYVTLNTRQPVAHDLNREVASLNEFRTFFGLEPHTTFESVNPDPEIQMALENLYDSPDMIEMYPGVFIEEIAAQKFPDGRHKPAAGVSFPKTAGRGVLSDAVTLVRSDRFYTLVSIVSTYLPSICDLRV